MTSWRLSFPLFTQPVMLLMSLTAVFVEMTPATAHGIGCVSKSNRSVAVFDKHTERLIS
jgi:hypothetical protein